MIGARGTTTVRTASPDSVIRKLRFDYLKARSGPEFRACDMLDAIMAQFESQHLSLHGIAQYACQAIQRQFRLRYVMMGFRSESDGLYRYEVHSGMREEAWKEQSSAAYPRHEFNLSDRHVGSEISKQTRVYLEEDNPLSKADEAVTNRPALLRMKRALDEEMLEGDFIDTLILGPNDDLYGWIEYSGTLNGKFPDPITVKHIEVVAWMVAAAIRLGGK